MKKKIIIGAVLGLVVLAACAFALYYFVLMKRGWVKTDAGTYFYDDSGKPYSGLNKMPDNTMRYFDPATNLMVTGEAVIDGGNYLFDSEGRMLYGRQMVNSVARYYNPSTGKMQSGWIDAENGKYYFDNKGAGASGLSVIDGKQYYFDKETGLMSKGKINVDGEDYFFDQETGAGIDGIIAVEGKTHGFIGGRMLKNSRAFDGKNLYYFGKEGEVVREIDGSKPMVALTYDDGPSVYTGSIIDTFEEYGQKCTFFLVGDRISWNEEAAKREAELGYQQGNHTFNHNRLTSLDEKTIKEKLKKTDDELIRISGKPSSCLRPPEGRYNDTVKKVCEVPIILWNVDSRDWESKDCDKVCGQVIGKVKDGDIVLMHDLYKSTAEATKKIVPALVKQGFQLVTVEEMGIIKTGGKGLEKGVVYTRISNK